MDVPVLDAAPVQDDPVGPATVASRASLVRGRTLHPGIQQASFVWRDILDGPPPRRRRRGEGVHVTYHGTEESPDVRISYSTIVEVGVAYDIFSEAAEDAVVHVDERINVQRRLLQELIDRERVFSDRLAARSRSALGRTLVRQRVLANGLPTWAIPAAIRLIKLQARVGYPAINLMRSFLRALVHVPDLVLTRGQSAAMHMRTRLGRRNILSTMRDPSVATPQEKSVLLVVAGFGLAGLILLLNTVFALILVGQAVYYQRFVGDFLASLLSVLALPIPQEPLLIATTLALGPLAGFGGVFVGKLVGSWMLYLIGDTLHDAIAKKTDGRPRLSRWIAWMKENADRYGFWMLTAINAIPFVPDLLMYVFAVSGMNYRRYMAGIALGTAIKYGAILAALYLIGPDDVRRFLEHPINSVIGA